MGMALCKWLILQVVGDTVDRWNQRRRLRGLRPALQVTISGWAPRLAPETRKHRISVRRSKYVVFN